jgi:opacity protein-like surface antigen
MRQSILKSAVAAGVLAISAQGFAEDKTATGIELKGRVGYRWSTMEAETKAATENEKATTESFDRNAVEYNAFAGYNFAKHDLPLTLGVSGSIVAFDKDDWNNKTEEQKTGSQYETAYGLELALAANAYVPADMMVSALGTSMVTPFVGVSVPVYTAYNLEFTAEGQDKATTQDDLTAFGYRLHAGADIAINDMASVTLEYAYSNQTLKGDQTLAKTEDKSVVSSNVDSSDYTTHAVLAGANIRL